MNIHISTYNYWNICLNTVTDIQHYIQWCSNFSSLSPDKMNSNKKFIESFRLPRSLILFYQAFLPPALHFYYFEAPPGENLLHL